LNKIIKNIKQEKLFTLFIKKTSFDKNDQTSFP
jgi:hypothetical protein